MWLMLFELYDRDFRNRNAEEVERQTVLYKDAEIEGKYC